MPTLELNMEQVNALRDLLGAEGMSLPECLMPVDHRLGLWLGCDRHSMYSDALFRYRWELIRPDGTLDLNRAEEIMTRVGEESPDLNRCETILEGWRYSLNRPEGV